MAKNDRVPDGPDFRSLFDATPDPLIVATAIGRITAANAAARKLLGRDAKGLAISEVLPEEEPQPPAEALAAGQWRFMDAADGTGGRVPLQVLAYTFESAGVQLIARRLCPIDASTEPQDAGARLAAIVQGSHDAIFSIDLDGTILTWNRAAERMYGYAAREIVGRQVLRLIPPDRHDEESHLLAQVRKSLLVEHYETVRMRKDGSPIDISLTMSPVFDEAGNVVGASKIARDIGRRKSQDALLERHRQALAESNAALEQFAYVASHDLQEPLRMVASYTQLLQRRYHGRLDEDADQFIAYAVDGARRMQALIQDLLAYSRIRTRPEKRETCDMQGLFVQAVENLRGAISESGATVEADELPTVRGTPTQMLQLLQNLIGNAIKFRNDRPPMVHVDAHEETLHWHFSVADNGIGIEPEFADRIFGIFQRLHGVGAYTGTGIGLAICREIAERHGGRIWVEPNADGGSTFHFTISKEGDDGHDDE